ncbi:serine hydrolase domain-containing protein [Nocardia fluminea]|uniref:serine hydrolase domain-containing protein n=1 Tax=Nocardia fluminea TaxID=134984 RepID=UPI0033D2DEF9
MRYTILAVVLASALTVSGCGGEPDASTLQRDVGAIVALGTTGVQARVTGAGTDRTAVAGHSDAVAMEDVSAEGYFRIGSLTKTMVATVVLMIVGEHRLSLDDTVQQWLPEPFYSNRIDVERITVRQLLQHTSGIHESPPDIATAEDYFRLRYQARDPRDTVVSALRHAPDFAPGAGSPTEQQSHVHHEDNGGVADRDRAVGVNDIVVPTQQVREQEYENRRETGDHKRNAGEHVAPEIRPEP